MKNRRKMRIGRDFSGIIYCRDTLLLNQDNVEVLRWEFLSLFP